jgi:hypothetical protein
VAYYLADPLVRSYREVGAIYGVPASTLWYWCRDTAKDATALRASVGRPSCLGKADEAILHEWILHRFDNNSPVTLQRIRAACIEIARQRGIALDDSKHLFGRRWWHGFVGRNGDLVVRNARLIHERMPTRATFDRWYASLEASVDIRHVAQSAPHRLWNMDETGRDGRKVNMRVVGRRGRRGQKPGIIRSVFREHLTLIACFCADGCRWFILANDVADEGQEAAFPRDQGRYARRLHYWSCPLRYM